jgi:hypothetical protein
VDGVVVFWRVVEVVVVVGWSEFSEDGEALEACGVAHVAYCGLLVAGCWCLYVVWLCVSVVGMSSLKVGRHERRGRHEVAVVDLVAALAAADTPLTALGRIVVDRARRELWEVDFDQAGYVPSYSGPRVG